jgi:hypothetical protein
VQEIKSESVRVVPLRVRVEVLVELSLPEDVGRDGNQLGADGDGRLVHPDVHRGVIAVVLEHGRGSGQTILLDGGLRWTIPGPEGGG